MPLLLIERAAPQERGDKTWTAVNPARIVQFVDVGSPNVTARPKARVKYAEMPGLTAAEKERVQSASEILIRKGINMGNTVKVKADPRGRKSGQRGRVWGWAWALVRDGATAFWARRSFGGAGFFCFTAWRVWVTLGLTEVVSSSLGARRADAGIGSIC